MQEPTRKTWWGLGIAAMLVAAVVYTVLRPTDDNSHPPDLGMGIRLVWVPPGTSQMGSAQDEWQREADEVPQHEVTVRRGFFIGACEVTQRQWEAVMGENPSRFRGSGLPVERVSFADAVAFCKKLSARSGRAIRLPTEAEWEFACRAGTTTPYAFGQALTRQQANCGSDLGPEADAEVKRPNGTTPVGSFPPNAWGLFDMHGNVWEWCSDPYTASPAGSSSAKTSDTSALNACRVVRGGGWLSGQGDCRSASRDGFPPDARCDFVGLRIVVER